MAEKILLYRQARQVVNGKPVHLIMPITSLNYDIIDLLNHFIPMYADQTWDLYISPNGKNLIGKEYFEIKNQPQRPNYEKDFLQNSWHQLSWSEVKPTIISFDAIH